jgi:hypothetical protein
MKFVIKGKKQVIKITVAVGFFFARLCRAVVFTSQLISGISYRCIMSACGAGRHAVAVRTTPYALHCYGSPYLDALWGVVKFTALAHTGRAVTQS